MSENDQHSGPNQDTGENVAMGKPGCMWFCLKCKPKIKKYILNDKVIEE